MRTLTSFVSLSIVVFSFFWLLTFPAWASDSSVERGFLTPELLQERLISPQSNEGINLINLRQVEIDLTANNSAFSEEFYREIQKTLNRSKEPLGIDFSQSIIKGEFKVQKLGLQTPLVGEALSPLLSQSEQDTMADDPRIKSLKDLEESSSAIPYATVFRGALVFVETKFQDVSDFSNSFYLKPLDLSGASFSKASHWSQASVNREAKFANVTFEGDAIFSNCYFHHKLDFSKTIFLGIANFKDADFLEDVNFVKAEFNQIGNLEGTEFQEEASFKQVVWRDRALFNKSRFLKSLLLNNATFEKSVGFRHARFNDLISLEGVSILEQVDFSNAVFTPNSYLDVSNLAFDSDSAKILGDVGIIGKALSVPTLEGNETVLQSLVRNFRSLEQIPDANQIEYEREQLRLQQLSTRLLTTPWRRLFRFTIGRDALHWLGLSVLLLLSDYGTNFSLVMSVGVVAIAYFGLLFWLIDRYRRRIPKPILPTASETVWIGTTFVILTATGITAIFQIASSPWLTLACLGGFLCPIPLLLTFYLYFRGRYHDLLYETYFVEDGGMRQLRLLIVRLPIMPRFGFFRDRYLPILWDRRWNWLNYYDFSLNNLVKLGFNDIRLRDAHIPGKITTLVWYQWSLGILFVALMLWTLSRTIPGLNLLIYLK